MKFEPKSLVQPQVSHLLTDIIVPRPIAWVSSVSDKGVYNLAPFSAYAMIGGNPMLVCFTVSTYRDGKKKDTVLNIELNKEFCISVVTEELAERMNQTSASYPRDVSEYEKTGLTPLMGERVKAPMVKESPINMECTLVRILEFGKAPALSDLVIGEVQLIHIDDKYYDKKSGRINGIKAVGRLGGDGDMYCRTGDTFQMKRPLL